MIQIFRYFESEIIVTPHIIAELSNLSIRDIKEPKIHYYFNTIVNKLRSYKEEHISLERLLGLEVKILMKFGFPDMSIIEVAKKMDAVILSDDLALCLYANSCKVPNFNFKNIISSELITA